MREVRLERAERNPGGVRVLCPAEVPSRRQKVPGGVFSRGETVVRFPEGRSRHRVFGQPLQRLGLPPHCRGGFEASGIAHEKVIVRLNGVSVLFAQKMGLAQLVERRGKPRACGIPRDEAPVLLRRIGIIPVVEEPLRQFETLAFPLARLPPDGRGQAQQNTESDGRLKQSRGRRGWAECA